MGRDGTDIPRFVSWRSYHPLSSDQMSEAYPTLPPRFSEKDNPRRLRLHGLNAKLDARVNYNHHVAYLVDDQDEQGDASDQAARLVVSLCQGFKNIRVKAGNTTTAARKPNGWTGLVLGCQPGWYIERCLLQRADSNADLVERIISFLKIGLVEQSQVTALRCSSSHQGGEGRSMHGPLIRTHHSWWISSGGRNDSAGFAEYVEYQLAEQSVRCEFASIRIPKLPEGPLSVRVFHLETRSDLFGDAFVRSSPNFTTLDTDHVQEFQIVPPIEAQSVRVVCTENAANGAFESIGY